MLILSNMEFGGGPEVKELRLHISEVYDYMVLPMNQISSKT